MKDAFEGFPLLCHPFHKRRQKHPGVGGRRFVGDGIFKARLQVEGGLAGFTQFAGGLVGVFQPGRRYLEPLAQLPDLLP